MELFNIETANTLQYFTFPLEAIGLSLALVEVRYPKTAAKIAGALDRFAEYYRALDEEDEVLEQINQALEERQYRKAMAILWQDVQEGRNNTDSDPWDRFVRPLKPFFGAISQAGMILLYVFISMVVFQFGSLVLAIYADCMPCGEIYSWIKDGDLWLINGLFATGGILLAVVLAWLLFTATSSYVTSFVKGRAVGTLGIIIAGLGLTGEAYQLVTQLIV